MFHLRSPRLIFSLLLCLLIGCAPIGPSTIVPARFDYNDAIIRSFDEQLLLNLVRLRYQDSVQFLDVSSVVSSYHREVGAELSPSVSAGSELSVSAGASGNFTWSESPTISYTPLQGEDFATRLLAPIKPTTILLLARSNWGLQRLLLCTVQQVNELLNGGYIGGVAPLKVTRFERFERLVELLRLLEENSFIQLSTFKGDEDHVVIAPGPIPFTEEAKGWAQEIRTLLQLDVAGRGAVNLEADSFPRKPTSVVMSGRSLLGVMAFLAQHVDAPPEHVTEGLVRLAKGPDGLPFDWSRLTHGLFEVHSGTVSPQRAYVKIYYRAHWFWIDDADAESKATYTLLGQLFWLQSASTPIQAPVLTLPAR